MQFDDYAHIAFSHYVYILSIGKDTDKQGQVRTLQVSTDGHVDSVLGIVRRIWLE
jgi:hypothetical protein